MQKNKFTLAWFVLLIVFVCISFSGCNFNEFLLKKTENKQGEIGEKRVLKKGGVLVMAGNQEPDTLNPFLSDLNIVSELGNLLFDGLIMMNEKGEWLPKLAMALPTVDNGGLSADGKTITFHLRQGVKWHDGTPFTAEDVRFTWQFVLQNKGKSVFSNLYENILLIDVKDAHTVIVKMKNYQPDWQMLFNFVLPKHALQNPKDIETFSRKPLGTGPFVFKSWDSVNGIEFLANNDYFLGRSTLDGIDYKVIIDAEMVAGQLKSGQIDVADNIPLGIVEKIKAGKNIHLVSVPNFSWEHFDFNLTNPLFSDWKVRQAIGLVLPRQEISDSVMKKTVTTTCVDQSPLSWAFNEELRVPERNLSQAKEWLKESGWLLGNDGFLQKNGMRFSFKILLADGKPERQVVADFLVRALQSVGIEANLNLVSQDDFWNRLKMRNFDTVLYASVNGFDPDSRYRWHSNAIGTLYGQNFCAWRNVEVDQWLNEAFLSLDQTQRKVLYGKVQQKLTEDCPVIPLFFYANISAVKNIVGNYKPNPMQWGNTWNAKEWCFFQD